MQVLITIRCYCDALPEENHFDHPTLFHSGNSKYILDSDFEV
jgi:hypothetical protein